MNKLRLLIIEDDEDLRDSYKKQIKLFNLDNADISIEEDFAEDDIQAKEKLSNGQIDAAIVDMKLGNNDVEYKGNIVISTIKNNLRFPAFILTANPEKIEEEKGNENDLFRIRIKGSEGGKFSSILEELKAIHLTGITKILGKSGQIERYLNEIFWKHLSSSINIWANDNDRNPEEKEKSLLRYTLLHMQEYLELNNDSDFDRYHPAEVYIIPPVKPNLFTGDIVFEIPTKKRYIILTPSCDLAQKKAKDILIGEIEENDSGIISEKCNVIKKGKAEKEEINDCKETLIKLLHNNYSNKYHYLPKYAQMGGGLINFQKVKSVRAKTLIGEEYERLASVNSQFTKDVIARFSYYYSRQGSPDFKSDEIYNSLFV